MIKGSISFLIKKKKFISPFHCIILMFKKNLYFLKNINPILFIKINIYFFKKVNFYKSQIIQLLNIFIKSKYLKNKNIEILFLNKNLFLKFLFFFSEVLLTLFFLEIILFFFKCLKKLVFLRITYLFF